MVNQNNISAEWLKVFVDGLVFQGLDLYQLCDGMELDYQELEDQNARISEDKFNKLWQTAIRLTNNPAIGLELVRSGLHNQFKPLIYTFLSSKSIKFVFSKLIPYQEVMSTGVKVEFCELDEGYLLRIFHAEEGVSLPSAGVDLTLSALVVLSRWVLPQGFSPKLVQFEHALETDFERYSSLLGEAVQFSAERNAILYHKVDCETLIETADAEFADYCDRLKDHDLQRVRSLSTSEKIRKDIAECLASGNATIEALAVKYCMTTRTLQRKLKQDGWTFRELVDDTRRFFAEEYIGRQNKTVDESTQLLGFTETSSFIRAFKRWFNKTPNQYKKDYNDFS